MAKLLKGSPMAVVVVFFLMIWLGVAGSVAALGQPCNDDGRCSNLEICLDGVCKTTLGQPCNDDRGCLAGGRNLQCRNGVCTPVGPPCAQDSQCAAGRLCINGLCQTAECRNNTQCGDRQVCGANNFCKRVDCTTARHCATDQTCNTTTNLCVARCPSGQAFVRSNT